MTPGDRILLRLLIGYLTMVVLCFGPALVSTETAIAEHKAECRRTEPARCPWGPDPSDAVPKAFFWPLWLSYRIALAFQPK